MPLELRSWNKKQWKFVNFVIKVFKSLTRYGVSLYPPEYLYGSIQRSGKIQQHQSKQSKQAQKHLNQKKEKPSYVRPPISPSRSWRKSSNSRAAARLFHRHSNTQHFCIPSPVCRTPRLKPGVVFFCSRYFGFDHRRKRSLCKRAIHVVRGGGTLCETLCQQPAAML